VPILSGIGDGLAQSYRKIQPTGHIGHKSVFQSLHQLGCGPLFQVSLAQLPIGILSPRVDCSHFIGGYPEVVAYLNIHTLALDGLYSVRCQELSEDARPPDIQISRIHRDGSTEASRRNLLDRNVSDVLHQGRHIGRAFISQTQLTEAVRSTDIDKTAL